MTKHRALTAIELLIGILVMTIVLSVAVLSPTMADQSTKREAERVTAYLYRVIQMSDRKQQNFNLDTFQGYISVKWARTGNYEDTSFKASAGCMYSDNFPGENGEITYNAKHRQFNSGGTITIKRDDSKSWYVIIAATEGRIRTSDTPPE